MQLTKDADKLVCFMYKSYLEKRKAGINKINALHFELSDIKTFKICSSWSDSDNKVTVAELKRTGLGKTYINGGFSANEQFIIYMENRFKDGLTGVVDFISKLIP